MKKIKIVIPVILILIGLYISGCNNNSDKTDSVDKSTTTQTDKVESTSDNNMHSGEIAMVNVPSIQCNSCKKTITNALKETEGVNGVEVDVKGKTVKVAYDKSKTDVSKIEDTIVHAGYDANNKKADKDAYKKLDDCCKRPEDQGDKDMHM